MDALDGLDAVGWATLQHGSGPADDVPDLLRAIVNGPPHVSDEAFITLFAALWNEGTVYPATAHVVPFLRRIAEHPDAPRRPQVLDLLGRIVRASAFPEIDDPRRGREEVLATPGDPPPELAWALAAKRAVGAGEASWVALLDDDDPQVRGEAAFVLSGLDELSAHSVLALTVRAVAERHHSALASVLLSLSEVDAKQAPSILSTALKTGVPVVKLAAAVALGRLGYPSDVEIAVDLLVAAIREPDKLDSDWQLVAGAESIGSDAREALVTLAPEQVRLAIGPLLAALPVDGCDTYQALRALLELVFPEQGRVLGHEALSPVQRAVLERVVATATLWDDMSDRYVLQHYFQMRGLPGTRTELRWFLGS
ncbi:MAG: hypothetical protein U1F43_24820 [Myxococcota bacterium]